MKIPIRMDLREYTLIIEPSLRRVQRVRIKDLSLERCLIGEIGFEVAIYIRTVFGCVVASVLGCAASDDGHAREAACFAAESGVAYDSYVVAGHAEADVEFILRVADCGGGSVLDAGEGGLGGGVRAIEVV